MSSKHEWRKEEKELYIAKKNPQILKVPKMKFIQISGEGNPNNQEFKDRIPALYSLAYTLKMGLKDRSRTKLISS